MSEHFDIKFIDNPYDNLDYDNLDDDIIDNDIIDMLDDYSINELVYDDEIISKIRQDIENIILKNITIKVIVFECKINTKFCTTNIKKLFEFDEIIELRSNAFFNNVSIRVKLLKPVSIKLFASGSISLGSGSKSISVDNTIKALNIVFQKMQNSEKKVVEDQTELKIEKINNLHISFINCSFNIEFNVDHNKLILYLQQINYPQNKYKQSHIGGIVGLIFDNMKIYIFDGGRILLFGRSVESILAGYNFINDLLLQNYNTLVIITI